MHELNISATDLDDAAAKAAAFVEKQEAEAAAAGRAPQRKFKYGNNPVQDSDSEGGLNKILLGAFGVVGQRRG